MQKPLTCVSDFGHMQSADGSISLLKGGSGRQIYATFACAGLALSPFVIMVEWKC